MEPELNTELVEALNQKSVAFPKPPNVSQLEKRWEMHGAPGFQCLPGFRPGMAGELGKFLSAWKKWKLTQRSETV